MTSEGYVQDFLPGMERFCEGCGKPFVMLRRHHRFCSSLCKGRTYAKENMGEVPAVSRSTMGAVSELIAGADLMIRGYEVFRAMSPATSCDLIAVKDSAVLRIEVRTGRVNQNTGRLLWPRNGTWTKHSEDVMDHYAVVTFGSSPEVTYHPELPQPASQGAGGGGGL